MVMLGRRPYNGAVKVDPCIAAPSAAKHTAAPSRLRFEQRGSLRLRGCGERQNGPPGQSVREDAKP
jgi:hypothetical protein